jgi:hypothetical protein
MTSKTRKALETLRSARNSDGVIVIPAHLADEIADETFEMTRSSSRRRLGRAAASSAYIPRPRSRR